MTNFTYACETPSIHIEVDLLNYNAVRQSRKVYTQRDNVIVLTNQSLPWELQFATQFLLECDNITPDDIVEGHPGRLATFEQLYQILYEINKTATTISTNHKAKINIYYDSPIELGLALGLAVWLTASYYPPGPLPITEVEKLLLLCINLSTADTPNLHIIKLHDSYWERDNSVLEPFEDYFATGRLIIGTQTYENKHDRYQ